jgi:hypothetical protein
MYLRCILFARPPVGSKSNHEVPIALGVKITTLLRTLQRCGRMRRTSLPNLQISRGEEDLVTTYIIDRQNYM